jgi:hypothetical protein
VTDGPAAGDLLAGLGGRVTVAGGGAAPASSRRASSESVVASSGLNFTQYHSNLARARASDFESPSRLSPSCHGRPRTLSDSVTHSVVMKKRHGCSGPRAGSGLSPSQKGEGAGGGGVKALPTPTHLQFVSVHIVYSAYIYILYTQYIYNTHILHQFASVRSSCQDLYATESWRVEIPARSRSPPRSRRGVGGGVGAESESESESEAAADITIHALSPPTEGLGQTRTE